MLVNRKATPSVEFAGSHLYTWDLDGMLMSCHGGRKKFDSREKLALFFVERQDWLWLTMLQEVPAGYDGWIESFDYFALLKKTKH